MGLKHLKKGWIELSTSKVVHYCLSPGCLSSLASGFVSGRCIDGCDVPRGGAEEPAQ